MFIVLCLPLVRGLLRAEQAAVRQTAIPQPPKGHHISSLVAVRVPCRAAPQRRASAVQTHGLIELGSVLRQCPSRGPVVQGHLVELWIAYGVEAPAEIVSRLIHCAGYKFRVDPGHFHGPGGLQLGGKKLEQTVKLLDLSIHIPHTHSLPFIYGGTRPFVVRFHTPNRKNRNARRMAGVPVFEQRGKRERRMVCHLYLTLLSYPFSAKGW